MVKLCMCVTPTYNISMLLCYRPELLNNNAEYTAISKVEQETISNREIRTYEQRKPIKVFPPSTWNNCGTRGRF